MKRFLVFAALLWFVSAAYAQTGMAVEGSVRDSISDQPLVGAKVSALRGRYGRVQTDSAGRYRLADIQWPEFELELHCPSRTQLGKRLLAQRVRLGPGEARTINLRINSALCDEPAPREIYGVFRGSYSGGFEESSFAPCADSALSLPLPHPEDGGRADIDAWVRFTPKAQRQLAARWPHQSVRDQGSPLVYVRWRGTLRGPGTFGHLGASAYEMHVDTVLQVAPWISGACRYPPARSP